MKKLCDSVGCLFVNVSDDFASLRLRVPEANSKTLVELHSSGLLTDYSNVTTLVERVMLFCPQNMKVEGGFSRMKFVGDDHKVNLSLDTYM